MKKIGVIGILRGAFRLLTPSHCQLIKQAMDMVETLYIFIDSDDFLEEKGRIPIFKQEERVQLVSSIVGKYNDVHVIVFENEKDFQKKIQEVQSSHGQFALYHYFKGGDYSIEQLPESKHLEDLGFQITILDLQSGRHTTEIIKDYIERNEKLQTRIINRKNKEFLERVKAKMMAREESQK